MKNLIKKFLLFGAMAVLTCKGHTQGSNSCPAGSTCIPNQQLQTALIKISNGDRAIAKLKVTDSTNKLLEQRIRLKDSIISAQNQKSDIADQIHGIDNREIANLNDQNTLRDQRITGLEKEVKRQKRKTIFVVGGAIAAILLSNILIHSK